MILIDTNILLRSKQYSSIHYDIVTNRLIGLISRGEELIVCPQVLYEFYVVATRPIGKNGLGLNPEFALGEVEDILANYTLLGEDKSVFLNWQNLLETYRVSGTSIIELI